MPGIQQNPIGANRIGDILEALLSQTGKADIHLVHRLIECRAGDANTSGLGHRLQARGNVYPVAIDVVSLNDDVAEIDADAKPDLLCFGRALIAARPFCAGSRQHIGRHRRRWRTRRARRRP